MSKSKNTLGGWAFLIGVVIAVALGVFSSTLTSTMTWILVVIGLIVGFLNVTGEEAHAFLLSGVVLIITTGLSANVLAETPILMNIMNTLMTIFVPATIVVAIKNVFLLARS